MKIFQITEATVLRRVIVLSGLLTLLISVLALTGWVSGSLSLASIFPEYLPMASATAILSAGFALVFLFGGYRTSRRIYKSLIIVMISLFSIYGFLKFLEYFLKTDLTTDSFFLPIKETLGQFPTNRMSPLSGLLFFLCGVATLLKILGKENLRVLNVVAGLGLIIVFAGFSGLMDYLFGTPLLYGTDIIPWAILTTIVFLMLGWGLVAMGGAQTMFLRYVFGSTASARILRAVIPILAISLLVDDFLNALFLHVFSDNPVVVTTTIFIIIIPITVWIMIRTSRLVFLKADLAEEASKKAQAALKMNHERNIQIIRHIGEGIAIIDPDEQFVLVNPAAERIFGVPSGGLEGHSLKDFLPPDQLAIILAETAKRTQKKSSTYEIDVVTSDNRRHNLTITATPYLNDEGEFTRTIGVFRDITEQKHAESELAKFTRELEVSNATKDKFFSIIAHDLKNPFNSIMGLTDILITDFRNLDTSEIETMLTLIKRSSDAAYVLLENLLLWANSQTGHISYQPTNFSLRNMINENILLAEVSAAKKKIRVVLNCSEDYFASGDEEMVKTVLRNLLSNAIKFTIDGGEIVISALPIDQMYEISIKDNGTGIAAEDIPKLFMIDSKHSTKGTANESGTGLGLILCKEFVEKNGGTIWVESEIGKGSTFYFTLPMNPDPQPGHGHASVN